MASRMKEDERNEKAIRGLLKLPANKRCINCNSLGPQYVCTNFWIFICTNCSGLHREFTHRVKSVSMAKFTTQEVTALQEGGNERARELYFKEWDPQRNSYPDSSNIDRLRDFIRHVYVDRRYAGERNVDRPPKSQSGREDYNESRRQESDRIESRSPSYGDRYTERPTYGRSGEGNLRYAYGERSPGDQGDYRRSPRQFEVADESFHDDKFRNGVQNPRFEDRRLSQTLKPEGGSPNYQKSVDGLSPPVIRPVRDIVGEDAPPLRVGDPPKPNVTKVDGNLTQTQRTSSSSSMGSGDGNPTQSKGTTSISLIDFNTDPDPPVSVPPAAAPPPRPSQPIPQQDNSPSANGGDWTAFDAFGQQTVPQVASSANPVNSALAQLSLSDPASAGNYPAPPVSAVDSTLKATASSSLFNMIVGGAPNNQPQGFPGPTLQGSLFAPAAGAGSIAGYLSQAAIKPPRETSSGVSPQPSSIESKSSGMQALPEDLFTSLYPSTVASMTGWQRAPQFGMGYAVPYPTGVTMSTFPQPTKSANPFDLGNEPVTVQASMFPSMPSQQWPLPNRPGPPGLLRTSSFEASSRQWLPPQQLSHQLSYPSAMPPSHYMMHQVPSNTPQQNPSNMMPVLQQGALGPVNVGAGFGGSTMGQETAARYYQPSTPSNLGSVGGNPFG